MIGPIRTDSYDSTATPPPPHTVRLLLEGHPESPTGQQSQPSPSNPSFDVSLSKFDWFGAPHFDVGQLITYYNSR